MLCLECGIYSGCGCYPPPKVKYTPVDHDKELKLWLEWVHTDSNPYVEPFDKLKR